MIFSLTHKLLVIYKCVKNLKPGQLSRGFFVCVCFGFFFYLFACFLIQSYCCQKTYSIRFQSFEINWDLFHNVANGSVFVNIYMSLGRTCISHTALTRIQVSYLPAVWVKHIISLSLSFSKYKMGINDDITDLKRLQWECTRKLWAHSCSPLPPPLTSHGCHHCCDHNHCCYSCYYIVAIIFHWTSEVAITPCPQERSWQWIILQSIIESFSPWWLFLPS